MNHEHEVTHLSEVDRRKFLQLSSFATGLVLPIRFSRLIQL